MCPRAPVRTALEFDNGAVEDENVLYTVREICVCVLYCTVLNPNSQNVPCV